MVLAGRSPLQRGRTNIMSFRRVPEGSLETRPVFRAQRTPGKTVYQRHGGPTLRRVGVPSRVSARPRGSTARPACQGRARRTPSQAVFTRTVTVSQRCHIKETYCKVTTAGPTRCAAQRSAVSGRSFFQTCISGTFYFLTERKERNRPQNAGERTRF